VCLPEFTVTATQIYWSLVDFLPCAPVLSCRSNYSPLAHAQLSEPRPESSTLHPLLRDDVGGEHTPKKPKGSRQIGSESDVLVGPVSFRIQYVCSRVSGVTLVAFELPCPSPSPQRALRVGAGLRCSDRAQQIKAEHNPLLPVLPHYPEHRTREHNELRTPDAHTTRSLAC
jgi:hypothetical protein